MAYRNIFIANQATMRLKLKQLVVDNGDGVFTFPIEDVRSIVIDNQYATFSAKLLSALAENGVCVIISNDKHTPSCELVPISPYHRQLKRISLQIDQSKPKLKRIWQRIVVSKIENQAECLNINGIEGAEKLISISKTVQSGDATNREGYAANVYFKLLFGKDFKRDSESGTNAALNYGYSIIRSYIAKTIVCEGLEPSLGIHHRNELNRFNLADDLIEPFRPIVDNYVYQNVTEWGDDFRTAQKAELVRLLNCKTMVNSSNCSLSHAIELLIQSIVSSFENDEISLKIPKMTDTGYFDYE